jgi:hypothetical protein
MGGLAIGRQIQKNAEIFELRDSGSVYNTIFDVKNDDIQGKNMLFWNV